METVGEFFLNTAAKTQTLAFVPVFEPQLEKFQMI